MPWLPSRSSRHQLSKILDMVIIWAIKLMIISRWWNLMINSRRGQGLEQEFLTEVIHHHFFLLMLYKAKACSTSKVVLNIIKVNTSGRGAGQHLGKFWKGWIWWRWWELFLNITTTTSSSIKITSRRPAVKTQIWYHINRTSTVEAWIWWIASAQTVDQEKLEFQNRTLI